MTFNTEKQKIFKLWNKTNSNKDIIVTQTDTNTFIVDGLAELNRLDSTFPVLTDFSSDWLLADTLTVGDFIDKNVKEFRILFNDVNDNFIPYIHSEVIYRNGQAGTIPNDPTSGLPFDEEIASLIKKAHIFKINDNSVEYITHIFMDNTGNSLPEIEYKFICYILNPNYYSDQ